MQIFIRQGRIADWATVALDSWVNVGSLGTEGTVAANPKDDIERKWGYTLSNTKLLDAIGVMQLD